MNVHLVNGQPWDSFDAYLFDIDGTLLNCTDAVHYFAFCDALDTLSGRERTLAGVITHGNTDIGILRDALQLAGVAESDWRPRLPQIRRGMGEFVALRERDINAIPLPHVRELLEHLRLRGAALGVATGNLQTIGELKLKSAGLLEFFTIGGWSDAYEYRADVFSSAKELMLAATGQDASICVVGDTPADVLSAHANGLPVIAMCTGVYSRDQLLLSQPELCLNSFSDLFLDWSPE